MRNLWMMLLLVAVAAGTATATATVPPVFIPDSVQFCGETVPLDQGDVRERLQTQLLVFSNSEVQMTLWHMRRNRFFPVIEKILKDRGLPDDLKYVCVIESALLMRARSASNAYGPWQFLAGTARERGLSIGEGIDERLHLEKATHAALDYLSMMKDEFGAWATAMAGYNAGPERIKREIYRQGTSNYYELVLPDETERYVFNAISVKLILENPEAYGFDFSSTPYFSDIKSESIALNLDNFVPVKMAAYCAGLSFREFSALNPWLNGVNIPRGDYVIHIPEGSEKMFRTRLERYFAQIRGFNAYARGLRVKVTADTGKMRIGPGENYPVFRTLDSGSNFRVSGRTGMKDRGKYWYIFKLDNGASGWIWGGELDR